MLDRRSFIASTVALSAVFAPVTVEADTALHPDAALLALGRELDAALVVERDALAAAGANDDAALDAAIEATGDIVSRIPDMPAKTMEGLLVKARAFLWCGYDADEVGPDTFADAVGYGSTDLALAGSIMRDLVTLAGREVTDLKRIMGAA